MAVPFAVQGVTACIGVCIFAVRSNINHTVPGCLKYQASKPSSEIEQHLRRQFLQVLNLYTVVSQ